MSIFRIAAEIFLIYLLYKLIFDFIIPVYRSTRKIKKQFNEMHSTMQDQMKGHHNPPPPREAKPEPKAKKEGDYIEFEEVK